MGLSGNIQLKGLNQAERYLGNISISGTFQLTVYESYQKRTLNEEIRKEDIYLSDEEKVQVEAFIYDLLKQREEFSGLTDVLEE